MSKNVDWFKLKLPAPKKATILPCIGITFPYDIKVKDFIKARLAAYRMAPPPLAADVARYHIGGWSMQLKLWWCHKLIWPSLKNDITQWLTDNMPEWQLRHLECTSGKVDDAYHTEYGTTPDDVEEQYTVAGDDPEKLEALHKFLMDYSVPDDIDTTTLSVEEIVALATLEVGLPTSLSDLDKAYDAASTKLDEAYKECRALIERRTVNNTEESKPELF